MSSFAERIRVLSEKVGSLTRLGELSGITPRTLTNYVSGRNEPKAGAIVALASAARVSPLWLLTGQGPMEVLSLLSRVNESAADNPLLGAHDKVRAFVHAAEDDRRRLLGLRAKTDAYGEAGDPAGRLAWARETVISAAKAAGFPPEADVDFVATMMTRLAAGEISEQAVTDAFRFYSLGKNLKGE